MPSRKPSKHYFVITVDVDGWSSLLSFYSVNHDPSEANAQVNVEEGISKLLSLFNKHNIQATFFVTGDMARKHSNNIVDDISREGHEVACHGLLHKKNECLIGLNEQRLRIGEATRIIETKTGVCPVGFRAPCLRSNKDTFTVLMENGYIYDSSIIPTFIPGYYGHLNLKFKPYWVSSNSYSVENYKKILELPVSVNPLLPLPLSAGWMRNLGLSWVKFGIKTNLLFRNPVIFYIHPRDVLSLPRVEGVPSYVYRNVGSKSIEMMDHLLSYARSLNAVFVRAVDLAILMRKMSKSKC